MKQVRNTVFNAGQALIDLGQDVQRVAAATNRPQIKAFRPVRTPLDSANSIILLDGDDFVEFFPRRMRVGSWGIVKFLSPIRRVGNTFSLKGVQMGIRLIEIPNGQKVPTVRVSADIVSPITAYPVDGNWLQLTEMDFHLQNDGHFAFVPTQGFSYAMPVQESTSAIKMWE